MKAPIFIRPLDDDERRQIQAGLHSSDAFVLRRCQILLASARGERAPTIGQQLGCNGQTVRNVITGFNAHGLAVLQAGSSRPHRLRTAFSEESASRLTELLHHSPRECGREQTFWTLDTACAGYFRHLTTN
jgi:Winged helix-turn helix